MADQNIFGPFPLGKFAGATISAFSVNMAWNEQSYNLNITIVEDQAAGDYCIFNDGEVLVDGGQLIGTAMSFTYGNFRFDGILKSFQQHTAIDGKAIFNVVLAPPNEVLDAVQVVLASYIGPNSDLIFSGSSQTDASFSVSNLLNVYGWAEAGGTQFGRSQSTDIGMPWAGNFGIQAGLQFLTNRPSPGLTTDNWGSYIHYKGQQYRLDLSNLPVPPSFYRVGGVVNMTLLELMSRFFEDAGCQYIVKLTIQNIGPHIISFVVVPRLLQQPLGKILEYINGQSNITSVEHGQEIRSDITQAFLVGGSLNTLQPIENNGTLLNILPFWGFDFAGNPIIGTGPGGSQFADDRLQMNLNATPVADIMGELGLGVSYPCSILEMRCALGNYDTWAAFVQLNKPTLSQQLKMYGSWDFTNVDAENIIDLLNDNSDFVESVNGMFQDNHWPAVAQRLYEFVHGQAEVYYGKKFIVILPFEVEVKVDPSTAVVSLNNEICDAGFVPEGDQILDLNFINENYFLDQTGRFYPFVRYSFFSQFNSVAGPKTVSPNVAYLKGTSAVTQYDADPHNAFVYSRCEQGDDGPVSQNGVLSGGSQIFFIQNNLGLNVPAMVVTVPDAIWAQADDITGSVGDLAAIINIPIETLQNIAELRSTSFNLVVHPPAFYPNGIAVALKSNQQLYGPWGKFTADGKLNFEQDDGLVPWEYGGYDVMTQAAIAKLNTIAMGNQVLERGNIVEAGLPKASLAEQLIDEGPLLTSVNCDINGNEVTTTYSMETFVNRVGAFTLENAEQLKRIGKIYQQLRRTMRQNIITTFQKTSVMLSNYQGFMAGTSYAVEQHTPHAVLGGRLYANNSGNYTPFAWTQTYQESLGYLGLNSVQNFQSTACAGMEVLLRPYTTNKFSDYLSIMPGVDESVDTSKLIIGDTGIYSLNPIQDGCDINWLSYGDTYQTLKTSKGITDYTNVRSMAMRGPIMLCGWGFDLQGNPVPNSGAIVEVTSGNFTVDFQTTLTGCNDKFIPDYLKLSNQWPAAPLDLVYDKFRSVWASPGMILEGVNSGNGIMQLYISDKPTSEGIQFTNFLGGDIPYSAKMQIGWNPLKKKWSVISVACTT